MRSPDVTFLINATLLGLAVLGIAFGIRLARHLQGGLDHFYEFLTLEREAMNEGDKHALRKKYWPQEKYEAWCRRRALHQHSFYVSSTCRRSVPGLRSSRLRHLVAKHSR